MSRKKKEKAEEPEYFILTTHDVTDVAFTSWIKHVQESMMASLQIPKEMLQGTPSYKVRMSFSTSGKAPADKCETCYPKQRHETHDRIYRWAWWERFGRDEYDNAAVSQLVESDVANVEVVGSSPIRRSEET